MRFYSYIFSFLVLQSSLISIAFSQHSDCSSMLGLTDTIYEANNIKGYGKTMEFSNNNLYDSLSFEEEKNSIWYLITVPTSGAFTFDITTKDQGNDWDFLLYEYKKMFCKRIEANKMEPIRSNLSRSSITGLSEEAMHPFVGAGINSNYSKYLQVKAGEQYVLVVNNAKKSGGNHTLLLHFDKPVNSPIIEQENPTIEPEQLSFSVSLKEIKTNKTLVGNIIIDGLRTKPIKKSQITSYQVDVPKRKYKLTVSANAKGYLLQSLEVTIPNTRTNMELDILLEPIQVGQKINLRNIQFHGNVAKFLPQASSDLLALLEFMQLNTNVSIEIEGHVNGPRQKNSSDYQELSEERALAVKSYLIEKGIDTKRIKSKGYGNTKMLFPDPKSETERTANRRVEIKIL